MEKLGIRQAKFVADIAPDLSELDHTVAEVEEKLGYPVFVKPSNAGSSCGVSKAENREELKAAVELAKKHDTRVLIEEMICGHEVECAVLGGRDPKASKVGEVVAAAEFYDYDAKYNNSESVVPFSCSPAIDIFTSFFMTLSFPSFRQIIIVRKQFLRYDRSIP